MHIHATLVIFVIVLTSLVGVPAHAQTDGDKQVVEQVASPAVAAAAEAARQAAGISAGAAAGAAVFLTPSSTASSAQSECLGTTNCNQGYPSTPPPPPALPPAPPAPPGYLPPQQDGAQLTLPDDQN